MTERELSTDLAGAHCNAIPDLLHLHYSREIILFPRDVCDRLMSRIMNFNMTFTYEKQYIIIRRELILVKKIFLIFKN